MSGMSGCDPIGNLANDLSSVIPVLLKYLLPILLVIACLFCLGSILTIGIGGLVHSAATGLGGSSAPPAGGQGTPPAPSQTEDSQPDQQTAKITILSTRVVHVTGNDRVIRPVLLVTWRNDSDQPVSELDGTVTIRAPGGSIRDYPRLRLYLGSPVQPGATHEDTGVKDGVIIASDQDPQPKVLPTEVK
jgi:hypothetical protein